GYKALLTRRRTFYADVHDFPAAAAAEIGAPEPPRAESYWQLAYRPDHAMSEAQALEGARERVHHAIARRLRADVPVAVRLSGG
ncbi:MAG: asparagine synthase (glutamine-hydrolyzing), partial [Gammaproteobacteria bacterium]|nr:asparagine synthase (glutamine-hydrolyzing) [Gammaproteobacteria bacterium]